MLWAGRVNRPLSLKLVIQGGVQPVEVYNRLKELVGSGTNVLKGLINVSRDVWNVTVATQTVKEQLLASGFSFNGVDCPIYDVEEQRLLVRSRCPIEVPDDTIRGLMSRYGTVHHVSREHYLFDRSLENGMRRIYMSGVTEIIPQSISVGNFRIPLWYRGQVRACHICDSAEHFKADCPLKDKCLKCKQAGHFQKDCPLSDENDNGDNDDNDCNDNDDDDKDSNVYEVEGDNKDENEGRGGDDGNYSEGHGNDMEIGVSGESVPSSQQNKGTLDNSAADNEEAGEWQVVTNSMSSSKKIRNKRIDATNKVRKLSESPVVGGPQSLCEASQTSNSPEWVVGMNQNSNSSSPPRSSEISNTTPSCIKETQSSGVTPSKGALGESPSLWGRTFSPDPSTMSQLDTRDIADCLDPQESSQQSDMFRAGGESNMEESLSEMDAPEDLPAYTDGKGEVLVPVSTSLGSYYRTLRRDSKVDKVKKQRKLITLSQEDFAERRAAMYKKSRKKKKNK